MPFLIRRERLPRPGMRIIGQAQKRSGERLEPDDISPARPVVLPATQSRQVVTRVAQLHAQPQPGVNDNSFTSATTQQHGYRPSPKVQVHQIFGA